VSGWDIAIAAIKAGGDNKNYVITLTGDIALDGDSAPTFGSVTGVTVSLRGEKTLSLDPVGTTGNLLRTGAGQTLILRSPLEGRGDNNASLVAVNGGILFMRAGSKIQNNTTTTGTTGGGVYVDSYGYGSSSFTM
jgi:hypothetical protein